MDVITTGLQTVTASGVAAIMDTHAVSGDFTITFELKGLTAGAAASIILEDTVSSNPFSDAQQVWAVTVTGLVGGQAGGAGITYSLRAYQVPNARLGFVDSKLRVNLLSLSGSSPSLTFRASVNYSPMPELP